MNITSCAELYLKKYLILICDPSVLAAFDQIQVKCKLCKQRNIEQGHCQNHMYQTCRIAIVTCSTIENNCYWIGLREELQSH
jgi:hypothetical protein